MENIIQFPKQPIKADAWGEYEQILKEELKGAFVLNGLPPEILTSSTMDRMRRIFERSARLPVSASLSLGELALTEGQRQYVETEVESAIKRSYPDFLSKVLTVGVLIEISLMEAELYRLRKAVGE